MQEVSNMINFCILKSQLKTFHDNYDTFMFHSMMDEMFLQVLVSCQKI